MTDDLQYCPACTATRSERSFAPNGLCIDCDAEEREAWPRGCARCGRGARSHEGSWGVWVAWFVWGSQLTVADGKPGVLTRTACEAGAEPICANCDGGGCVCVVVRDWDAAARCDGKCCPVCQGTGIHDARELV
jgi:hypothetical protein